MNSDAINTIVISRTDSIGDVALSLPLAGILKDIYPKCKIIFLGRNYTRSIIQCCTAVDEIWDWDEIAAMDAEDQIAFLKEYSIDVFIHVFPRKEISRLVKKAKIPIRIGTSHRFHHIFTCNKLVNFTRKKSELHEAQLNTKLLQPLGVKSEFTLKILDQKARFKKIPLAKQEHIQLLDTKRKNIIFHAKSQGSALEWGVDNFIELSKKLDQKKYKIFFTGTENEATFFRNKLPDQENIIDLSGSMTLDELIGFISNAFLLVAASTGPLHIAGLCGINSLGLFSPRRPIHPGRWKPLGPGVKIIEEQSMSARDGILNIPISEVISTISEYTPAADNTNK